MTCANGVEEQARKIQSMQMLTPSAKCHQSATAGGGHSSECEWTVPRAGKSYRFARPLVLEEETKITFQYKSSKSRSPLKRQKFAGWEGRFTPAQDSQPLILELIIHS